MQLLTKHDLEALIQHQQENSVSIYIPTHRAGRDIQQNPIRLKNVLQKAVAQLIENGMVQTEVDALLAPASTLLNDAVFWQHQLDGLAIFLDDGISHIYRLPTHVDELLVIAESFYTKPLLPLVTNHEGFYILTLSQGNVRLYHATQFTIEEVTPDDMPADMAEALRFDQPRQHLQQHAGTVSNGGQSTIYHGHDATDDSENKKNILRFFQQVDDAVSKRLGGKDAPLILAGIDYLIPIYTASNSYPHLHTTPALTGSPDQFTTEQLHQAAWDIVEPLFHHSKATFVTRYHQQSDHSMATSRLSEILPAAHYGRIDTLMVADDVQCWGKYDLESNTLEIHTDAEVGDEDLLDRAAQQTFIKGGNVYTAPESELPTDEPIAALLRY